jgi:hypothetical protein
MDHEFFFSINHETTNVCDVTDRRKIFKRDPDSKRVYRSPEDRRYNLTISGYDLREAAGRNAIGRQEDQVCAGSYFVIKSLHPEPYSARFSWQVRTQGLPPVTGHSRRSGIAITGTSPQITESLPALPCPRTTRRESGLRFCIQIRKGQVTGCRPNSHKGARRRIYSPLLQ